MKTESCEIRIRGMICRSCTDEVSGMLLLRTKGVVKATVSYRKAMAEVSFDPALVTPDELERRIKSLGYETGDRSLAERLLDLGCAALTVLLAWLLLRWGGASPEISGANFGALFLVGLSTSPHCLGMCGGILLSACAGRKGRKTQLGAALGYNGGRMISYTALGAVFGALGTVLTYTLSMKSMLFTMLGLVVALLDSVRIGVCVPGTLGVQDTAVKAALVPREHGLVGTPVFEHERIEGHVAGQAILLDRILLLVAHVPNALVLNLGVGYLCAVGNVEGELLRSFRVGTEVLAVGRLDADCPEDTLVHAHAPAGASHRVRQLVDVRSIEYLLLVANVESVS